jgi:serine/threonine protein kinase
MSLVEASKQPLQQVGRYAIFDKIAAGGMATVHVARLVGFEGFSRVVAVKRMHRHFLQSPDLKRMFVSEARLAARVRHPNVVPILDVIVQDEELFIVMDYVHGESLLALLVASFQSGAAVPLPVAASILVAALQGLHAAHEARDEQGRPLGIVHRDVSPHNMLVGTDGVTRLLDFGVAKAVHAHSDTNPGMVKGKFSYMAPELIRGTPATLQADIFSAATVFWELLASRKLFNQGTDQERLLAIVAGDYPSPRKLNPTVSAAAERIVMKGLHPDPEQRYKTALEMAIDIERELPLASQRLVGDWVQSLVAPVLEHRANLIHQIEISTIAPLRGSMPPPQPLASLSPLSEYALGYTQPGVPDTKSRRWPRAAAGVVLALALVGLGVTLRRSVEVSAPVVAATSLPLAPPLAPPPPPALSAVPAAGSTAAPAAPNPPSSAVSPAAEPNPSPSAPGEGVAPIEAPAATASALPRPSVPVVPRNAQPNKKPAKKTPGRTEFLPNEL